MGTKGGYTVRSLPSKNAYVLCRILADIADQKLTSCFCRDPAVGANFSMSLPLGLLFKWSAAHNVV
jgi:hypothetical protein